MTHVLHIDF